MRRRWRAGSGSPCAIPACVSRRTGTTTKRTSTPCSSCSSAEYDPDRRSDEMSGVSAKQRAAWGQKSVGEMRWPASLAVIAALLLYITLPERLTIGPVWIVPALELALLVPLSIAAPRRVPGETHWLQIAAITLIVIINIA